MKRLILAGIALAVGCGTARNHGIAALVIAHDTALDDTMRIALGRMSQTSDNTVRIAVRSKLPDSRCAASVQCVWAGSAGVGLRVETAQSTSEGDVHTNAEPRVFWAGQHQISLLDLTPRPGEPNAPIVATLRVVRLGK